METIDKKSIVLKTIQNTTDENIIEEVYDVLYPEEAITNVMMEDLPNDLQVKLNRAINDYKTGNYISNEQMKEKMKEWLAR